MGKYYSNPLENNFYRCFFQPFYCVAVFAECWHCGTLQIFVTRRPIRLFCWYLKALRWRSSMPDWDSNTYRYCVVLVPPEQQTLLRFHRKHSTCLVSPNIFTSGVYSTRNVAHKRKQKVCIKRPSDGVRVSSFWVITARFFSIRETVVAVRNETKPPYSICEFHSSLFSHLVQPSCSPSPGTH